MKPPVRFFELNPTDEELMYLFETTDRERINKIIVDSSHKNYIIEKENILSLYEFRKDKKGYNEFAEFLRKNCPDEYWGLMPGGAFPEARIFYID